MLDRGSRGALRTLSKESADIVARHLVAAGQYLETDPERAHQHALAAQRRAGRVDVVREAVAITAYHTGRYADALREARTVRRLSGDDSLRAIEADSERGLGRPERALAVIGEVDLARQPAHVRTELAIVASGARADLGEFDAGLLVVEDALLSVRDTELRDRLLSVKADRLDDLGRHEEAEEVRAMLAAEATSDDAVLYIDETLDEGGAEAAQDEELPGPEEGESWDEDEDVVDEEESWDEDEDAVDDEEPWDEDEDAVDDEEPDDVARSSDTRVGGDDDTDADREPPPSAEDGVLTEEERG